MPKRLTADDKEFDVLDIDPDKLMEEWLAQPRLHFKFAMKAVDARARRDQLKAEIAVAVAELDYNIRQNPVKYDFDADKKPTEPAIKKYIESDPKIIKLQEDLQELAHDCATYEAFVECVGSDRKKSLEQYTNLMIYAFNAEPRMPTKEAQEHVNDMVKRSQNRRQGVKR